MTEDMSVFIAAYSYTPINSQPNPLYRWLVSGSHDEPCLRYRPVKAYILVRVCVCVVSYYK